MSDAYTLYHNKRVSLVLLCENIHNHLTASFRSKKKINNFFPGLQLTCLALTPRQLKYVEGMHKSFICQIWQVKIPKHLFDMNFLIRLLVIITVPNTPPYFPS